MSFKLAFYTNNNFSRVNGGTVRMKGILSELIHRGLSFRFVSCAQSQVFSSALVDECRLATAFSKFEQRAIMFFLALLPFSVFQILFGHIFQRFRFILSNTKSSAICVSFEYFDNSLMYILHMLGIVDKYYIDIHGIADLEFLHNSRNSRWDIWVFNLLRASISSRLDKKVFSRASKVIVLNFAMIDFYLARYPEKSVEDFIILDDGVSSHFLEQEINPILRSELLNNFQIHQNVRVVFFIGTFKSFGGVPDLVAAYLLATKGLSDCKLILIGYGEDLPIIEQLIRDSGSSSVHIVPGISYDVIKTYMSIADIIVCPDKLHPYSNMIVHTKFYEAISTGKVVINGDFDSIKAINANFMRCLVFSPSNVFSLAKAISYALANLDCLTTQFSEVNNDVSELFTYKNNVKSFHDLLVRHEYTSAI